jgi:hypothetical protein
MNARSSACLSIVIITLLTVLLVGTGSVSALHYWAGLGWLASTGITLGVAAAAIIGWLYYIFCIKGFG